MRGKTAFAALLVLIGGVGGMEKAATTTGFIWSAVIASVALVVFGISALRCR